MKFKGREGLDWNILSFKCKNSKKNIQLFSLQSTMLWQSKDERVIVLRVSQILYFNM